MINLISICAAVGLVYLVYVNGGSTLELVIAIVCAFFAVQCGHKTA